MQNQSGAICILIRELLRGGSIIQHSIPAKSSVAGAQMRPATGVLSFQPRETTYNRSAWAQDRGVSKELLRRVSALVLRYHSPVCGSVKHLDRTARYPPLRTDYVSTSLEHPLASLENPLACEPRRPQEAMVLSSTLAILLAVLRCSSPAIRYAFKQ
jgi:hypothetical protein